MRVASSTFELQDVVTSLVCKAGFFFFFLIPVVLRSSIVNHSEHLKETNMLIL